MKICVIGKFPPIQGGVSRSIYWLVVALAQASHQVHVVTNSFEADVQFRIYQNISSIEQLEDHLPQGVHLHSTTTSSLHSYIPYSNPFVTKLASIGKQIVNLHECELILGSYFEPYGIAAYLTSKWTGVPFGIQHAGSDVGRLMLSDELGPAYNEMILSADFIFPTSSTMRRFISLGVDIEKLYALPVQPLPETVFNPKREKLDLVQHINNIKHELPEINYFEALRDLLKKEFIPDDFTIGIYGKVGRQKGSFDLLRALHGLKMNGKRFNLLAMTQGHRHTLQEFVAEVYSLDLQDRVWLLPFVPHWEVPNFIRTCDAICFLERKFSVAIHQPSIPREVFSCGVCLIVSNEIFDKQQNYFELRDKEHVIVVDPTIQKSLVDGIGYAIDNPEKCVDIGINGTRISSIYSYSFDEYSQRLSALLTTIHADVMQRRNSMSLSEMQAVLARLYVDSAFRKLSYFEPDETFSDYALSDHEQEVIKSIDRKLLENFAQSLMAKRRRKFESVYSATFRVAEEGMHRFYRRYYDLFPIRPNQMSIDQIIEFGEFIEDCLRSDETVPLYTADLCKYERLYYITRFRPHVDDTFENINASHNSGSIKLPKNPKLSQRIELAEFEFDVISLIKGIKHETHISNVEVEHTWLIFQQIPNSLEPKIFTVNEPTHMLCKMCNGKNDLEELANKMSKQFNVAEMRSQIENMLVQLVQMRVIVHE